MVRGGYWMWYSVPTFLNRNSKFIAKLLDFAAGYLAIFTFKNQQTMEFVFFWKAHSQSYFIKMMQCIQRTDIKRGLYATHAQIK